VETAILIFLAIAVAIIALALILPRLFRKSIARDRANEDLNGNQNDGRNTATWIGINRGGDHHRGPDG